MFITLQGLTRTKKFSFLLKALKAISLVNLSPCGFSLEKISALQAGELS